VGTLDAAFRKFLVFGRRDTAPARSIARLAALAAKEMEMPAGRASPDLVEPIHCKFYTAPTRPIRRDGTNARI